MKQYRTDRADRNPAGIANIEVVDFAAPTSVAEPKFRYGAEAFETYQREAAKIKTEDKAAKNASVKNRKSR